MRGLMVSLAVKEMPEGGSKAVIREGVSKLWREVCSAHSTGVVGVVCNIFEERDQI